MRKRSERDIFLMDRLPDAPIRILSCFFWDRILYWELNGSGRLDMQEKYHSCPSLSAPTATYRRPSPSSLSLCCSDWRCIPNTDAARVTLPPDSSKQRAM